jgi:hypothetical protein
MNVQVHYDLGFLAGVYYNNRLQLNSYRTSISMLTQTTDKVEINTAVERLKCFIDIELANTVFINQNLTDVATGMNVIGANITTLPDEPVDQIVGMMLYCKLNAIMEGRVVVTKIDISSILGEDFWYIHEDGDNPGPFDKDGWWHSSDTKHNTFTQIELDDNVLKVTPPAWSEYDLTWPEDDLEPTANTVVFANFSRNEDNPVR